MNKRKPDDEFAMIDLSYLRPDGTEIVVHCPETKGISETLEPMRRSFQEQYKTKKLMIWNKPN